MARKIEVSGYDPFSFQDEVDVILHITGKPPRFEGKDWEAQWKDWIDRQATTIANTIMNNVSSAVSWRVLIKILERHQQLYAGNEGSDRLRDTTHSLAWAVEWLATYIEDPDGPNIDPEFKDNWDQAVRLAGK